MVLNGRSFFSFAGTLEADLKKKGREKKGDTKHTFQQIGTLQDVKKLVYCMSNDLDKGRRIGGGRLHCLLPDASPLKFKLSL